MSDKQNTRRKQLKKFTPIVHVDDLVHLSAKAKAGVLPRPKATKPKRKG